MKSIDINKIKLAIDKYNHLSKESKLVADSKIQEIKHKIFDEFKYLCANDEDLIKALTEMKEIKEVLDFKFDSCFEEYAYTINEKDPEFAERVYKYSEEKYKKAKSCAKNWETIKSEIMLKIEKLKNSKLTPFKNRRIEKLNSEFESLEGLKNLYNYAVEKENKRKNYIEKGESERVEKIINDKLNVYAENVVSKYINKYPVVACVEHSTVLSSSFKNIEFNDKCLGNIYNTLYQEALIQLEQENLSSI